MKQGILLINLGTPDSSSAKDVRRFLREFLMDPLVVDLPYVARWLLVNCLIVPFRGPKSSREYQRLWTDKGSPLKVHTQDLTISLSKKFDSGFHITMAMRYQHPSIDNGLQELREAGCTQILIIPLFPQYAEATSLSVLNKVSTELARMKWQVPTKSIKSFATNVGYINSLTSNAKSTGPEEVDHTLMSFHGLPERQLKKLNADCFKAHCCDSLTDKNKNCYRAQCFATSRALAAQMHLSPDEFSVCFQSRQGRIPWTRPYIDDVITDLARGSYKNIRVFSPAFVADCLETIIEIGHTYKNLFKQLGGDELHLVPGLNHSQIWVDALEQMILKKLNSEDVG